jgi:hypothetical protein
VNWKRRQYMVCKQKVNKNNEHTRGLRTGKASSVPVVFVASICNVCYKLVCFVHVNKSSVQYVVQWTKRTLWLIVCEHHVECYLITNCLNVYIEKYISDIIVDNKTKLKAIEIQSLLIMFIFLLKISKV